MADPPGSTGAGASGRDARPAAAPEARADTGAAPVNLAAGETGDAGDAAGGGGPGAPDEHRAFYVLGVGVQTLLWLLVFLAIVVAVAVGGELTEFRYVGF